MNTEIEFGYRLPENSKMLGKDFLYGVATAAFQIEGSTFADGRLPSIWDSFCEKEGKVLDGDTGEVACDHYRLWEEDLKLIRDMNFAAYRFSIAWPRVMTRDNRINHKGMDFYKRLVERMNEYGILPFATLYHWDLPQHIEDRGGWLNRESAYLFADYAEAVSKELGNEIHSFATLNEPWCSAFLGYGSGVHAPGLKGDRLAKQAGHHLLLGHGLAMQALRANAPKAESGIVLNVAPMYSYSERYDDWIVAKFAEAGGNHWFAEPILEGRYPHIVNRMKPEETPLVLEGDMELIGAPVDFIGINYYTRNIASYHPEHLLELRKNEGAEFTHIGWEVYPEGLTDILVDLNKQYRLPKIYITENGMAEDDCLSHGRVKDIQRCRYFDSHLNAVHGAMEKGVNVAGYFAWSLMDNFEWAEGYSKRFGIVHVDYETQKRTLKESAKAFRSLLEAKKQK